MEKREEMEIDLGKNAFDIDFHPSRDLITAGLIDGDLHLYRYSANVKPQRLLKVRAHTESCRAVRFINAGQGSIAFSFSFFFGGREGGGEMNNDFSFNIICLIMG